jgi:hypothetical protein
MKATTEDLTNIFEVEKEWFLEKNVSNVGGDGGRGRKDKTLLYTADSSNAVS